MDLSEHFDPTLFYQLNKDDKTHIGIRMVTELARDIRYFSAFNSNNLIVSLDLNGDEAARAAACLPASGP